jgi:hypothetical protein
MRRAGLWLVAVCVGCVAVWLVQALVHLRDGAVSGAAAGLYSLGTVLVFGFTTAWVVTWLESISRPSRGSRLGRRAH